MTPHWQNGMANGTSANGVAPNGATAGAGPRRMPVPAPDSPSDPAELSDLAGEMAAAFGEMVNTYRKHYKLSTEEAAERAAENSSEDIDRILNGPPNEVSWFDLDALAQKDERLALDRWEQIKQAARKEIRSGYRASRTIEDGGGPWERARFLAVRAELTEAWQPRAGVEQHLVDQLAQWQLLLWRWQEALSTWTTYAKHAPRRAKKGESYETMRMSEAEALEGAARKVDQLHRSYLRTLKALQDQRRPPPPLVVRHAEQVNVGPVRISMDNLGLSSQNGEGSS